MLIIPLTVTGVLIFVVLAVTVAATIIIVIVKMKRYKDTSPAPKVS